MGVLDWFSWIDSNSKNVIYRKKGNKRKSGRFKPVYYDCDTVLGMNNDGRN